MADGWQVAAKFCTQKPIHSALKSVHSMENTVFLRRKRCFPMEKTIFLSCVAMLSHCRSWSFLRTTLFSALLPPATHLPPPSKYFIYSGLSGVGGRVAANWIEKNYASSLPPIYRCHSSQSVQRQAYQTNWYAI